MNAPYDVPKVIRGMSRKEGCGGGAGGGGGGGAVMNNKLLCNSEVRVPSEKTVYQQRVPP